MKVSKTVSIELDLLQQVLEKNQKFSEAVTIALENWLTIQKQSEEGNIIHFSKTFKSIIPPKIIWRFITFDGLVKWVNMIKKAEYVTEHHTGLGTTCILHGKVGDIEATSRAEIIEYKEYEKMVVRSQGEFTLFLSVILNPKVSNTEVRVIIVVGLSSELGTENIRREIYSNLNSAFDTFRKVASTMS